MLLILMKFWLFLATCHGYGTYSVDTDKQLPLYKQSTRGPIGIVTTSAGAPVYINETEAINSNLLFNTYFMDSFAHFDRERIVPRVVHEKGAGALGYFEVTNDVTHICNAKLFNMVGKKTKALVRFSPVFVETGGSDTSREARGFAVKFYTEDGNLDLLMLDVEMFFLKDPILFISYSRAFKRNPQTFVQDPNARWDYIVNNPESMFMFMRVFGDRGIPDGYRYLPGFTIHPFQVVNNVGNVSFVKFILRPNLGLKNLTSEYGSKIQSIDLDYASRDLYNAIANKEYPQWTLYMQVMSLEEVNNAAFDVFDITKVWPKEIPTVDIGQLILNQNPVNYFAEIEQAAFGPTNLVPGILGGVDSVFQARRFVYMDTQTYRLGSNFNNIRVNSPTHSNVSNYNRDGVAPVKDNGMNAPSYYPNSFNGPVPANYDKPMLRNVYVDPKANNFDQAANLYTNEMSEEERTRLVNNIVESFSGVEVVLQIKAIELFQRIHPDFALRVWKTLLSNFQKSFP